MKIFYVDYIDDDDSLNEGTMRITVLANDFVEAYNSLFGKIDPETVVSIQKAADVDIASPVAILTLMEMAKKVAAAREAAASGDTNDVADEGASDDAS